MKHIFLLIALFLGNVLSSSAMTAPAYAAPVDTTKAVKIAKKAEKLMAKGQEAEAWDLYEEAGKMGLVSAQRKLMDHYSERGMLNNTYYWMEMLAKSGEVDAQYEIGLAYVYGPSRFGQTMFDVNPDKAIEWFSKAYAQGNKESAYFLGLRAIDEQRYQVAVKYLEESADVMPYAYYMLGGIYYTGEAVEKNLNKAFRLFKQAAEAEIDEAMLQLGYMYMEGEGCTRDYEQGIYWSTKAADSENQNVTATARNNINVAKERMNGTAANDEAVRAYRKGAELGQDVSQCNLANCYWRGEGIAQDYEQAVYWYHKASEKGNVEAQSQLGIAYTEGLGVKKDIEMAKMWFERAAEQNDTTALYNLAFIYQQEQDFVKAFRYAKRAADLDCAEAIAGLPYYYFNGVGTFRDPDMAYEMAQKAANRHHRQGYIWLGVLNAQGIGIPKDISTFMQNDPNLKYKRAIASYKKAYDPALEDCHQIEDQIARCYSLMESYKECMEWALKADTPWANYMIGWMYASGNGCTQNNVTAKRYLQKAANQTDDTEVRNAAREILRYL